MHPAVIVCIVLAVLTTAFLIWYFVAYDINVEDFMLALFIFVFLIIGGAGFGLVCTAIPWNKTQNKIPVECVESYSFKNNGFVVYCYKNKLYWSDKIEDYQSINNIDYYILSQTYNAYNIELSTDLYPIPKGKIDDYIKEK